MARLLPFGNTPPRVVWLRSILLLACLLTMTASAPLWMSARVYPLLPAAAWLPVPEPPWDRIVFGAALLALVVAPWFYRSATSCFLLLSFYLAMADQARLQPWFYMYWILLLLSLAKAPASLAVCRVALSAVYFWSGLQKCNAAYFELAVPWLARGGADWLPGFAGTLFRGALAAAPAVEIFIALALWFRPSRRVALALAVAVHAMALLLLGPLGHKHNWIVWPWNITMPLLLVVLFPPGSIANTWPELPLSRWAAAVTALFATLPILSFFGYWDSYLSFSLYTGKLTKADVYISEEVKNRLPPAVRPFVVPTPPPYHPEVQGPYVVLVELWADKILRVPPLPESRGYLRVANYLTQFASDPNEVRLILIPRVGPVRFYLGSDLRKEAGIPLNL